MANKRVSQLVSITAQYLSGSDLLLLADVSANQSKKLALSDLEAYFSLNGAYTGSLSGTASYASLAATASYVASNTASYSYTSSWALNINTASYANGSLTASYSATSSYSNTASYALFSAVQSVLNSNFADYARTASYLVTSSAGNGTASYALTASYVAISITTVPFANTSSWSTSSISASYAYTSSQALTASLVNTSSYLAYNGFPNGTASYALFAQSSQNVLQNYGTFYAITQSKTLSQLDLVAVLPTAGNPVLTEIELYGTVNVPYTSSHVTNGRIELFIIDRNYGYTQSLDFSPIIFSMGGVNTNPTYTGSLTYPFGLNGQVSLYGTYELFATASGGVWFEPTRNMRYQISSFSDQLLVSVASPPTFTTIPSNALMYYSSSIHPGGSNHFYGSASQVIFSGSYDATDLLIPPSSISAINYLWTLSGIVTMSMDGNGVGLIGGLPPNCISMSAAFCALTELPNMASSSVKWLNVPNNYIYSNLVLPATMSYVNVGNNLGVVLPDPLPYGMTTIIADGMVGSTVPLGFSNTLQTMSFITCSNLTTYQASSFPTSLTLWNSSGSSQLKNLPTSVATSPNLKYFDISGNYIPNTTISTIASDLVSNGLHDGYLSIINNPLSQSAPGIAGYLNALLSRNWTIVA